MTKKGVTNCLAILRVLDYFRILLFTEGFSKGTKEQTCIQRSDEAFNLFFNKVGNARIKLDRFPSRAQALDSKVLVFFRLIDLRCSWQNRKVHGCNESVTNILNMSPT